MIAAIFGDLPCPRRYAKRSIVIQPPGWNAPPHYLELVHPTDFASMSPDEEQAYHFRTVT